MLEYLKSHIVEEINGATDYMMKAIQHKGTSFGSYFYRMSEMEIEHANCLTKMFRETEKPSNVTDAAYASMLKEVMDSYAQSMSKLEVLKRLYLGQV